MKLRDVMSSRLFPVGMNDHVDDAACLMADQGVAAAPVLNDSGRLVGIITATQLRLAWLEKDLNLTRPFFPPNRGRPARTVGELMSTPVASLTPGADIAHAAAILQDRKVPCVLIVDGFSVVGLVNREDLTQPPPVGD